MTLEFESIDILKEHLDLNFKNLVQIFSDQFVPLLMNETLKQLKKASTATEVGGGAHEETKTMASKA